MAAVGTVLDRKVTVAAPRIRLVAHTQQPYGLAVASARTCYASDFVFSGRLDRKGEKSRTTLLDALPQFASELAEIGDLSVAHDRRIQVVERLNRKVENADIRAAVAAFADLARQRADSDARIAHSIYEAGHHTPFQHPTFVFAIEGVSRNVVESFFHNHTFYNSEQQSQRYVEMKIPEAHVPASVKEDPAALAVYEHAVAQAWHAYHTLRERLVEPNHKVMAAIGRIKGQSEKEIQKEAEKKAQEMARYVIPIAAATQMYHTVSGIVLLRYIRMCQSQDAGDEARVVVEQMVEEVRRIDPTFFTEVRETPRPRTEALETTLTGPAIDRRAMFNDDQASRLVHATPDAHALVAATLREVTGSTLPDAELVRTVMDPRTNPEWGDTLNTWDHSPLLRTLHHVHYTFQKRLSLTAYAQDQRHRMTPGTRPSLRQCLTEEPDVHTPDIIAAHEDARALYDDAILGLWAAMARLRDIHRIPLEDVVYLLPNATNVYYHQSGDLLAFIHKWRLRTCFNAQKEIFDASIDELRAAQKVHPELTMFFGPPCLFVAARQPAELQDSVEACCPEGSRWCGVKVWLGFDAASGKPRRPY